MADRKGSSVPQTATFSQDALIAEIAATERYLSSLKDALTVLGGHMPARASVSQDRAQLGDLRVWKAVRNYLFVVKREASYEELAEELAKSGTPLGTYPLRNISTAVKKMESKNIFVVTKRDGKTFVRLAEPHITAAAA